MFKKIKEFFISWAILFKKIKEFFISWAIFDLYCEANLQNYDALDFLNFKRLNPYYWKLKKEVGL